MLERSRELRTALLPKLTRAGLPRAWRGLAYFPCLGGSWGHRMWRARRADGPQDLKRQPFSTARVAKLRARASCTRCAEECGFRAS